MASCCCDALLQYTPAPDSQSVLEQPWRFASGPRSRIAAPSVKRERASPTNASVCRGESLRSASAFLPVWSARFSMIDSYPLPNKLEENFKKSPRSFLMKSSYGRLLSAACLSLFYCTLALAQDPMKVEPTHYKLAFENEYVQVVNVHYGAHEKSVLHAHMGGVVVVLTAGHLRFTDENGKTQEVFAKPGDPRWFPPFKHRVENLGDTAYNAVYIGIKNKRLAKEAGLKGEPSEMNERTKKLVAEALLATVK